MTSEGYSSTVRIGQLVDMKWKVGVAVTSDDCHNLGCPMVTLTLTTSDPEGQHRSHTVELTVKEFRYLSRQFQEMARCMEMV